MKKIAIVVMLTILVGCASAGRHFGIEQANKVKNGMTREEVIEIMGTNPYSITNQGKTFIWSYAKVGFMGGTQSRAVRFNFDDQGKAYGIPEGGVYGDAAKYQ